MLVEFTLGNFKSFRDRTTFSMVAANLTSEDSALDEGNVIPIKKGLRLLKTAALYGANASGKSNFGVALRFVRRLVLDSAREAATPAGFGLELFLLNRESREQPSFFEMVFRLNGTQFRYGFEVSRAHIASEWLFHVPKTKEVALFVREGQEIDVRAGFKGGKGLEPRTRPEALFLSVCALFNGPIAQQIGGWFRDFAVTTGLQDDDFREQTLERMRDIPRRGSLVNFIRSLDLSVDDIFIPVFTPLMSLPIEWTEDERHSATELAQKIFVVHRPEAGGTEALAYFDLDQQESQGTRKLIAMAGPLQDVLEKGRVLFVDELDARLHPLMTRRIVELFHSPLTNPKGAQLIFATHDTNLLDKSLFRRDQIWFTEKDAQGATHLTSLADYRVRNGAAFAKNYLDGRYGAIPFLGDLDRLPWNSVEESQEAREAVHA